MGGRLFYAISQRRARTAIFTELGSRFATSLHYLLILTGLCGPTDLVSGACASSKLGPCGNNLIFLIDCRGSPQHAHHRVLTDVPAPRVYSIRIVIDLEQGFGTDTIYEMVLLRSRTTTDPGPR